MKLSPKECNILIMCAVNTIKSCSPQETLALTRAVMPIVDKLEEAAQEKPPEEK